MEQELEYLRALSAYLARKATAYRDFAIVSAGETAANLVFVERPPSRPRGVPQIAETQGASESRFVVIKSGPYKGYRLEVANRAPSIRLIAPGDPEYAKTKKEEKKARSLPKVKPRLLKKAGS